MTDHDLLDAIREALTGASGGGPAAALAALAGSGIDLSQLPPDELLRLVDPPAADVHFGSGGYHGSYDGIANCWYSSDGYVYAPDGTRVGTA